VFVGAGYLSGGKTGTAQAVGLPQKEKYNAAKMEEHLRDHSLYIAFAPAEDPKIALAVIVENAGFGAVSAAPIARRAFDYWLLGQYPSEEDMVAVSKGLATAPIGKPRLVSDVPWPPRSAGGDAVALQADAVAAPIAAGASGVATLRPTPVLASGAAAIAAPAASAGRR
jgi:penicillin-binding protein 2